VNAYDSEAENPTEILKIDPEGERQQVARLRAVRERRDAGEAKAAMAGLTTAAQEDRNLMPPILTCVQAEVTLGEIADALRGVFGEYSEP